MKNNNIGTVHTRLSYRSTYAPEIILDLVPLGRQLPQARLRSVELLAIQAGIGAPVAAKDVRERRAVRPHPSRWRRPGPHICCRRVNTSASPPRAIGVGAAVVVGGDDGGSGSDVVEDAGFALLGTLTLLPSRVLGHVVA